MVAEPRPLLHGLVCRLEGPQPHAVLGRSPQRALPAVAHLAARAADEGEIAATAGDEVLDPPVGADVAVHLDGAEV